MERLNFGKIRTSTPFAPSITMISLQDAFVAIFPSLWYVLIVESLSFHLSFSLKAGAFGGGIISGLWSVAKLYWDEKWVSPRASLTVRIAYENLIIMNN